MSEWLEPNFYIPQRDGSLKDYLNKRGLMTPPLFNDPRYFKELRELGFLKLGSGIRVMHSMFGLDESYWVNGDFKLEGISVGIFEGKEGVHEPEDILKDQYWEFLQ